MKLNPDCIRDILVSSKKWTIILSIQFRSFTKITDLLYRTVELSLPSDDGRRTDKRKIYVSCKDATSRRYGEF